MFVSNIAVILLGSACLAEGVSLGSFDLQRRQMASPAILKRAGATLDNNAISSASALTGQEGGTEGVKAGQAASKTDEFNFINICSGKTLTNGEQKTGGSCNSIPMGDIPASSKMISAILTNPNPGDQIAADTDFTVTVQTINLAAGKFTNPTTTYYSAPQELNNNGEVIGHCHITIQNLGGTLSGTTPPDPSTFAFFKGIDDAGNGNGLLSATVTGGLPAGFYRVCTIISAQNHQSVVMPVAQRGAQDDCTKFEVSVAAGNGGGNGESNAGTADGEDNRMGGGNGGGNNAGNNGGNNNNNGGNNQAAASSAATAAPTAEVNNGGNNNGGGNNGNSNGGNNQGAASSAATAAPTAVINNGNNGGDNGANNQGAASSVGSSPAAATTTAAANFNNGGNNNGNNEETNTDGNNEEDTSADEPFEASPTVPSSDAVATDNVGNSGGRNRGGRNGNNGNNGNKNRDREGRKRRSL